MPRATAKGGFAQTLARLRSRSLCAGCFFVEHVHHLLGCLALGRCRRREVGFRGRQSKAMEKGTLMLNTAGNGTLVVFDC